MNEELLTIKEVARVLNCGIPYVYKLTDNGLLPYIKLGHKRVRRSAVNEFILKYENKDLSDLNNIQDIRCDHDK